MDFLIIPTYNRPNYLQKTLECLKKAINENIVVILTDDGSDDKRVREICRTYIGEIGGYHLHNSHSGVAINLRRGIEFALGLSFVSPQSILYTLDSDFMVKPDFFIRLGEILALGNGSPDTIVTGFNATSHPIIEQKQGYAIKKSIGGGNLCCPIPAYRRHIKPFLTDNMWDWKMVASVQRSHGTFLCATPSLCQHIGMISILNHPRADVAMDYEL